MWCKCHHPLHRGSVHLITVGQKREHQLYCQRLNIPFTDLEAEGVQGRHAHADRYDINNVPGHGSDKAVEHGRLCQSDVEQIADDDGDHPTVADWLADATADDVDSELGLGSSSHNTDTRALDMFDAFNGTPRAKVERMRQAIARHYGVNIRNPTRKGRQALDDMIGDITKPVKLDCCADGCVAFTGRLLDAVSCPSCRKGRYDTGKLNY